MVRNGNPLQLSRKRKLTELKVDLQQKDDEVESLKKENRNLRSQLSNLSIPPVAVLWTRP